MSRRKYVYSFSIWLPTLGQWSTDMQERNLKHAKQWRTICKMTGMKVSRIRRRTE